MGKIIDFITHALNDVWDVGKPGFMKGYLVNDGYGHLPWKPYYNEKLVEIPFLFRNLRAPPISVLDIGCSESMNPIRLASLGYSVTGIDMQNYNYGHKNFSFVKANFLHYEFKERFDAAINISAIEHFGLFHYETTEYDLAADRKAVEKVHKLLKQNGQFIFTAPYGVHKVMDNFERIYDAKDLSELLKGFKVLNKEFYVVKMSAEVNKISEPEAQKVAYEPSQHAVACLNLERL